jgi:hypothetical protein
VLLGLQCKAGDGTRPRREGGETATAKTVGQPAVSAERAFDAAVLFGDELHGDGDGDD